MHRNGLGQFDPTAFIQLAQAAKANQAASNPLSFANLLKAGTGVFNVVASDQAAKRQADLLKQQTRLLQAQAAASQAGQRKPAFFGLNPVFVIGAVALGAFLFFGKKRR